MKYKQMHVPWKSLALLALLSQSNCSSVSSLIQQQAHDVKAKQVGTGEDNNNELIDMDTMGAKIGNLQMSMLNKKQSASSQVELELGPNDEQMILINSNVNSLETQGQQFQMKHQLKNQLRSRLRHRMKKDFNANDLNADDVMAYSALANDQSGEDSSIFGSGGAISQALEENDPSMKEEEKPAPKKLTEGELLKIKQQKEAAQKLADKKKKDAEEKKRKEDEKKKELEKKQKEQQSIQEKEDTAKLERQTHLLESFLDDDKQTQRENESDYYYIKNPKKSLTSLAENNVKDQTEVETANDILKKSRKHILTGMDGGLGPL